MKPLSCRQTPAALAVAVLVVVVITAVALAIVAAVALVEVSYCENTHVSNWAYHACSG